MEYFGKKIWEEEPAAGDGYRSRYVEGIQAFIRNRNEACKKLRRENMPPEDVAIRQKWYRKQYEEMLGLELFAAPVSKPAEITYVGRDDVCEIYRLSVFITEEIPFYSMVLIPLNAAKPVPLVIAQHGGFGTPELCSDMNGKNNYNHMVQRALARGAAVLAPQLMLWSTTEQPSHRAHPIAHNRHRADVDLKRFGSSFTALEISGIRKSLDYVCGMQAIDPEKIFMMGLSYGGYFTLHTMAAEPRIKAGYSAGCFNDRDVYDWADWSYKSSALLFQDAEVAALCAPRKLYLQVGIQDPVFDYHSAVEEAERIGAYYAAFGASENFRFDVWEGGHTISDHDDGYRFLFDGPAP